MSKKKVTKKSSLGRGLDALLASRKPEAKGSEVMQKKLGVELLQPGQYQPRGHMDQQKLKELADSIQAQGIVQPIVVREIKAGRYEIIAGERRWRAAQLAKLSEVPVIIKDVSDQQTIAMALIENIQREDLNPLEEALALERLIKEFDLTHQQAADAVGRSRVSVSNLLRLLDLNNQVKQYLVEGLLDMGHARALLALAQEEQLKLADEILARKLNVRQAEALIRNHGKPKRQSPGVNSKGSDVKRVENSLSEKLCTRVELNHVSGGKGRLIIHYHDSDQLQGILDRIK